MIKKNSQIDVIDKESENLEKIWFFRTYYAKLLALT
jgi:hypothetical protein